MSEAVPAEQADAAEKKRPLLRRVPTSVVVTLLGIALTAWLLPAFTRQWDDRQKAQQLKGDTIQLLTSSFARMYVHSRRVWRTTSAKRPPHEWIALEPRTYKLLDEWEMAMMPLLARIRTYFPTLRNDMERFARIGSTLAFVASSPGRPDARVSVRSMQKDYGLKISGEQLRLIDARIGARGDSPLARAEREDGFEKLIGLINVEVEALGSEILNAHPRGYSTTAHDLLRDLIP